MAADPAATAPSTWESSHFSLLPRSFQKNPYLNIMVVTELTPAGKKARTATPEHPQSYVLRDGGLTTEGDPIAGEEPPKPDQLLGLLKKSLAINGYVPVKPGQVPRLEIIYRWGSYNKIHHVPKDDPTYIANLYSRALIVGGTAFANDYMRAFDTGTMSIYENRDARTNFLVQTARSNLYFLIAAAFDARALMLGQRVQLWHTSLSTTSQGIMMSESIPALAATGGPYFGRATDGPVRLNRPEVPSGHVEIGVPTVVEPLPSGPMPKPAPSQAEPPQP